MYIDWPPDWKGVATWRAKSGMATVSLFRTDKGYRGLGMYHNQLLPDSIDSDEAAMAEIERLIATGVYQAPMKKVVKK